MTETPTTPREQLLHLADRARRGVALPAEHDALHQGINAMAERLATAEDERALDNIALRAIGRQRDEAERRAEEAGADRNGVQERACHLAERLRKAEARVTELEQEVTDMANAAAMLTTLVGKRAERAEAAIERAQKLATQWAVLRAYGSAATQLRAALDPQQPTTEAQTCSTHVPDPNSATPLRTCHLPAEHRGWHRDEHHQDCWLPSNPDTEQQPTA